MKPEQPQKLGSYSSSSSLSNSSQSSGSLNSLDSQSSFSSSCTITAEQEEAERKEADNIETKADSVTSHPVDCDTNISQQTGSLSDSMEDQKRSTVVPKETASVSETGLDQGASASSIKAESGYGSATDVLSSASTASSRTSSTAKPGSEFASPVQPVLGVQIEDLERSTPMFFIKPVTSDGVGITGEEGARLHDKGKHNESKGHNTKPKPLHFSRLKTHVVGMIEIITVIVTHT